MIIINLKGGLGNQMFQYACGRSLALKNNDTLKLEIDGLERANKIGDIYRSFGLSAFAIEKNIATAAEVQAFKYPYGVVSKGWRWIKARILKQLYVVYEPSVLNWKGNIFLDGYFQSPQYFETNRKILLNEFTLVNPLSPAGTTYETQIQTTTSVSLHVRRGDYIKNPRVLAEFGVCSLSYYQTAIAHIKTTHPNSTFFVFSDDITWVRENLDIGSDAVFVSDATITDYQELILMSKCEHNIIANSSFSWWGAWLNQNYDKIVITPTPWFETAAFDKNLIPQTWIQLPK